MGQRFHLFNLDNPEAVANSARNNFGEFLFCRLDEDDSLLQALWIPNEDKERVLVLPVHDIKGYVFPQPSSENFLEGFFGQLTAEIIDKVFDEVDFPLDLLSLMTTCQRHWDIGRRHLEGMITEHLSLVSWAGDRLICLGDYVELGDLPKGMLTACEVKKIEELYMHHDYRSLWQAIDAIRAPRRSSFIPPGERIKSGTDFLCLQKSSHDTSDSAPLWFADTKISVALGNLIRITNMCYDTFSKGRMVFRDLTAKEYVRGDIWNTPGDSRFAGKRMTFEHVLYIRVFWASSLDTNEYQCPVDNHRGAWAGHRFDISSMKNVINEDGTAIDRWKDVTLEVINEVMEVLRFKN